MTTHLLLEAALRSLVMGVTVFAALRLLRIHQVRAQRTAWLLALAGAMAMPALVAAQIGPRLLPHIAVFRAPWSAPSIEARYPSEPLHLREQSPTSSAAAPTSAAAPAVPQRTTAAAGEGGSPRSTTWASVALQCALAGYCIVAGVLLLRHTLGIVVAFRLRGQSERIALPFAAAADIRVSARVSTPLTIASTILLPSNYSSWEVSTLRIVLSHESAHVRQRDFYVQMLAGMHCAIFWFNPFSWWLQQRLSDLAEALSDHAAVAQAESRVSYAEILLAFAARASSPMAAVPMARVSNLTPRIERLLSDGGFEQSFADKRRLPFIAAGVVVLTMAASTSMTRVQAESSQSLGAAAAPAAPGAPMALAALAAPAAPAAPAALPAAAAPAAPAAPVAPSAPAAPHAPATPQANSDFDSDTDGDLEIDNNSRGDRDSEKFLAIHSGGSRTTFDEGRLLPSMPGDYIYFRHQGKSYVIQDPSILARTRELLAPMQEYGRMQRELAQKEAELARQQASLARQQTEVKIGTPDFHRDIAELTEVLEQLKRAQSSPQIDRAALAELEGKLGAIQGNLGSVQAEFGVRQGDFGARQGALGELQGRLGEQQGRLGEQRRRLIDGAKVQLKPLVEEAIRDGKAKPIQ